MRTPLVKPIEPAEWFLVRLEDSPWGELYRVVIGLAIIPLASPWSGDPSGWPLAASFLAVLGSLRILPAVARRMLPFSNSVQHIWTRRRQIAKRCDSYQWQKLWWVGLGLALHILLFDRARPDELVLTAVCLASGGAGTIAWRVISARTERARWFRRERTLA